MSVSFPRWREVSPISSGSIITIDSPRSGAVTMSFFLSALELITTSIVSSFYMDYTAICVLFYGRYSVRRPRQAFFPKTKVRLRRQESLPAHHMPNGRREGRPEQGKGSV